MAPSQGPPVGNAAKLWETARAQLAKKEFDTPKRSASESLEHCKAEGVSYGEAAASLVLGLVELGRSAPQGSEVLALLEELGAGWGEAAALMLAAELRVADEGPAEAAKQATTAAAAAGSDHWTKAAELSVVSLAGLKKDGPAGAREAMEQALRLSSTVGLGWGETGTLAAASVHLTVREPRARLEELVSAAAKAAAGKDRGVAQLRAAGALLQLENPEAAQQAAREALSVFRELGARDLEATALHMMAQVQTAEGSVLEALQAANQAAVIFKELGHRKGQAASLLAVAQAQAARHSTEEASWKAAEALKIFRQLGCRMEEGATLATLAECALPERDFAKGLEVAQQALALSGDLGDGLQEGLRLCLLSRMHIEKGDAEESLKAARDALAKLESVGNAAALLSALDVVSAAQKARGMPEAALKTLEHAREGLTAEGHKRESAQALCRIAELCALAGFPKRGLAAAKDAGAIFQELGDGLGSALVQRLVAELHASQGDTQMVFPLAEAAADAYKLLGRRGMAGYLATEEIIIGIHLGMGAFEEALAQGKDALKYFNSKREKKFEASIMMTIADVEERKGDGAEALSTLQQVPALFLAVGDKLGEARAWMRIARAHFDKEEPDLALHAAEEALTAYRKLGDRAGKIAACRLVAEANFSLVPSGLGSARDCLSAAQEVVEMYQKEGDKASEAEALNNLANAHCMSRNFVDAQKMAFQAEELFSELGDVHGQASALLLTSGANLGDGKYADATSAASQARDLFRRIGDNFGEDNAEDFIAQIESYQRGHLSRADFFGFAVASPDDAAQQRKRPRTRARGSQARTDVYDIECWDAWGEPHKTTVFFDKFETRSRSSKARASTSPVQQRARGGMNLMDPALGKPGAVRREQVLYTVRWVKTTSTVSPRDTQPRDIMDRRIAQSGMFKAPTSNLARTAPSERMFHAYGGEIGV